MARVEQDDCTKRWFVFDGAAILAGPFDSNAEAWRAADAIDASAAEMDETRERISKAMGQW